MSMTYMVMNGGVLESAVLVVTDKASAISM